jgi:hypothetical protein
MLFILKIIPKHIIIFCEQIADFFAFFPCFEEIKAGLCDHHAVYVSVSLTPYLLLNGLTNFYETWYAYDGT